MKVLHVVHQYHPDHTGGTELYTQQIASRQAMLGHDVHVITPAIHGSVTVEDNVTVHRIGIGKPSRTKTATQSIQQPKLLNALADIIEQFDLVHIQHLMGWPLKIIEKIIATKIPYIITLHDYWFPCVNAQLLTNYDKTVCNGPDSAWHNCGRCVLARGGLGDRPQMGKLVAPMMKFRAKKLQPILEQAAAVIAPTNFVQSIYEQTGFMKGNFTVIPHGIELPKNSITTSEKRDGTSLHAIYIGSIAEQKGIHVLIEAFNQLPIDGFKLTIAGSLDTFPQYSKRLAMLIDHAGIGLIGRISHEAVWNLLTEADVFVMPTLWYEVSPLTIDETFAMGTPIIASDIGAATEKIRHGVDGFLFPTGDSQELATILRQLRKSPDLLNKLSDNIQPVNTVDTHVTELENLYEQTVSSVGK